MTATLLATFLFTNTGICDTKKGEKVDGKKEFEEHCEVCHPNGGNLINSRKPLTRKALRASGVKSAKDIIDKIRNPGPDMTKFDENTISNKEAKAIAEYVLKTFK
jgi:cytochrome c6